MTLFSQIFSGDVKKRFRGLVDNSIEEFKSSENAFLRKWEDRKNPLQLLTQYNNLKRSCTEIVQEFSNSLKNVYDSIPPQVKPPEGVAQLHYVDAFDACFALFLRERKYVSLTNTMNDAIEVEVNIMSSRKIKQKTELKKVKEEPQDFASQSTSDAKFDIMMIATEILTDNPYVVERTPPREHNDPQIRNPNFRRPQGPLAPQILQRGQRNQNDQVRPPFEENLIAENYPEQPEYHIH